MTDPTATPPPEARRPPSAPAADVGSDVSGEQLREALSSLARARDLADRRARENALITEVLSTLLQPQPPPRLIARILQRLRTLLPFDSALVLEPGATAAPDTLTIVFASPGSVRGRTVPIGPMLRRVQGGRVVNVVDAAKVPELTAAGLGATLGGGVLALPIAAPDGAGVLLLGSADRGAFSAEDASLGQRLSVLGSQVQVSLQAREMRARAASLAAEKAAAERARDASERREAIIRTLFDGLPIGIYLKNPDGQYRIVNQAMDALLGRSVGGTVGRTAADVFGPEIGRQLMEDTAIVLGQRERIAREVSIERAGEARSIRVTKARVDLDGTPLIAGTILDITDQRTAEHALVAAKQAAESANAAKTAFLATMSHEIRTPLNGVIGMIGVLGDTGIDADQRRLLHAAQQSAEHLLAIVNDILDMSKLEAGKLQLETEPFALRPAIADVVDLMRPAAGERGNRLLLEAPIDADLTVLSDLGRLRQVLFNLIGNAAKFTRDGTVTVTVAVAPGLAEGTVHLDMAVRDTGVGIAPDKVTAIFERFSQADNSITRTFGGTGLGLAICKEICALMGGDIGVESVPGQGSTFRVHLPVCLAPTAVEAAAAAEDAKPAAPSPAVPALRVLVVDDVPVNCDVLAHMLRRDGHRVDIAHSGGQAVAMAARGDHDAILMDVQMPDMDGISATRAIRALEGRPARVPIVAVTASAMAGDRERFIAAGMDRYLSKPVRPDAVRRILGGLAPAGGEVGAHAAVAPDEPATAAPPQDRGLADFGPAGTDALAAAATRIDRATIDDMADFMGAADLAAVWAMLREDLSRRLDQARHALEHGDPAAARPAFHAIKGSTATYGLIGLSDTAAAAEKATDPTEARRALAVIETALPTVTATMDALLAATADPVR